MSEGLIYTHWKTGTKGGITRISSCAEPDYKYPEVWHPRMDLQVTPSLRTHRVTDACNAEEGSNSISKSVAVRTLTSIISHILITDY